MLIEEAVDTSGRIEISDLRATPRFHCKNTTIFGVGTI